jgi:hypothetical protein
MAHVALIASSPGTRLRYINVTVRFYRAQAPRHPDFAGRERFVLESAPPGRTP